MDKKYTLLSTYNGDDTALEEKTRYFKGETEILFDFSEVAIGTYSLIKIICDFNDKSPLYTVNYDFSADQLTYSDPIKHIYHPSDKTDNIFYYPTFYLYFSNFKKFIYQTPFRITKESFYSKYKKLDMNSVQFVDDADNSLFLTMKSSSGDIFNSKIK